MPARHQITLIATGNGYAQLADQLSLTHQIDTGIEMACAAPAHLVVVSHSCCASGICAHRCYEGEGIIEIHALLLLT